MPLPIELQLPLKAISPNFYSAGFHSMGSACQLLYKSGSLENAGEFHRDMLSWLKAFEARYSRYGADSLICEINRNAGEGWVDVDAETDKLFALCDSAVSMSHGCFDPSALPLIQLWDYKASRTNIPDAEAVNEALSYVGWSRVEREKGKIRLPGKGMGIDVGGIGKEYAVDMVVAMALEHGIDSILVDFGQDLRVLGESPDGESWRIGLEDPSDPGRCWSGVALQEGAVATSGDYRRNFIFNGKRYGHIIDPRNGYPVSNHGLAVSVIAPLCTTAGVLATTAFILGPDAGLPLIGNQYGAEGCIVESTGRRETQQFNRYYLP